MEKETHHEEQKMLKEEIIRNSELGKAEAGLVYKYDDEGNVVRVDDLPLSRKECRMFKRLEQRRLWKAHKAQSKAKWEKEKINRYGKLKEKE